MASTHFTTTDKITFTPISTAISNLRNAQAGTIIVLVKQTTAGAQDFAGVTDSGGANFFHMLASGFTASTLGDDDNVGTNAAATWPQNTTDWYLLAEDWSSTMGTTQNFHWKDQTTLGSWTHSTSAGTNNGTAGSATTSGLFKMGFCGDLSTGSKDMAVVACWAGTRFANTDYGSWTKTSDLWNHPLGKPQFLCELNASTPVDLAAANTYSATTGTSLTGANPDNWTFDAKGAAAASFIPSRMPLGV